MEISIYTPLSAALCYEKTSPNWMQSIFLRNIQLMSLSSFRPLSLSLVCMVIALVKFRVIVIVRVMVSKLL